MRQMKTVSKERIMKLYAIGVGPGDPMDMTLKAAKALNEAPMVFVPTKKEGVMSFAYDIAKDQINKDAHIEPLVFPMNYNMDELGRAWDVAAKQLIASMKEHEVEEACFIVIGDITMYSTYLYIHKALVEAGVEVEFVPGITSYSKIASLLGQPLAMWEEGLAIVPASKDSEFELNHVLDTFENVVVMKPSHNPKALAAAIRNHGLENNFSLITKAGTEEQVIIEDIDRLEEKVPYLSTMLIKKNK